MSRLSVFFKSELSYNTEVKLIEKRSSKHEEINHDKYCYDYRVNYRGIVGFYFYNQSVNYIKTDNAQVDGDQIKIASPVSGKMSSLDVREGDTLKKGILSRKYKVQVKVKRHKR